MHLTPADEATRVWRALVEADVMRWNRIIGHGLYVLIDDRQFAEIAIAVRALNRMLEQGPEYVCIA